MSVTARGFYSIPVQCLRVMLSECTALQKLFKAASATAALASIHIYGKAGAARPFALVERPKFSRPAVAGGASNQFVGVARQTVWLEFPIRWSGTVTTGASNQILTVSALAGYADDHLNGLNFVYLPGASEEVVAISDFDGATGQITLASALSGTPAPGDAFKIRPASDADAWIFGTNVLGDVQSQLEAKAGGADLTDASSLLGGELGPLGLRDFELGELGLPARDETAPDDEYFAGGLEMTWGK